MFKKRPLTKILTENFLNEQSSDIPKSNTFAGSRPSHYKPDLTPPSMVDISQVHSSINDLIMNQDIEVQPNGFNVSQNSRLKAKR